MSVLTPTEFSDKWKSSKLLMNAAGSYNTAVWKEFIQDLIDSYTNASSSGNVLYGTTTGDGTDTFIVTECINVAANRILAVLVGNTNYLIGRELTYTPATGTFVCVDVVANTLPITVFFKAS